MSFQAMTWALRLEFKRSSEKFVLVCMANYADERGICYPSIERLERDTCQDRKTIIANIKRLIEAGYVVDTGKRVGATSGIIVYRLLAPSTAMGAQSAPRGAEDVALEAGNPSRKRAVPKTVPVPKTEQFRNSAEAVPFFPGSSTENGTQNLSGTNQEPKKKRASASAPPFVRPDWIDADLWDAFLDMRKKKRAVNSDYALKLILGELEKLRAAGEEPIACLKQSVQNSWVDVYPVRDKTKAVAKAVTAGPPWWSTEAGIIAKGKELGLNPRAGETMPEFKGRISVAIEAQQRALA